MASTDAARCTPERGYSATKDHARHCVIDGPPGLADDRTAELMAAVARLMRRG